MISRIFPTKMKPNDESSDIDTTERAVQQAPQKATSFLSSGYLASLSDDVMANIVRYCVFDEAYIIMQSRPILSTHFSLADVLMTVERSERHFGIRHVMRPDIGSKLHIPSAHRLFRILKTGLIDDCDNVCETCGIKSVKGVTCLADGAVSFHSWWGLWLCNNCECQTHCDGKKCYMNCDHSLPKHFTRWDLMHQNEGIRGELWNSHRGMAYYRCNSEHWAGILSTPKFDRFTGEHIGSIITEHHVKQIIMHGKSVDEFLKELPPVSTAQLEEYCRLVDPVPSP